MNDSERQVRQTDDSLLHNQKSATGQEQAFQDETIDILQLQARKGVASKTTNAITDTLRSVYFTNEVNGEQASYVLSSISVKMTERQAETYTNRRQK